MRNNSDKSVTSELVSPELPRKQRPLSRRNCRCPLKVYCQHLPSKALGLYYSWLQQFPEMKHESELIIAKLGLLIVVFFPSERMVCILCNFVSSVCLLWFCFLKFNVCFISFHSTIHCVMYIFGKTNSFILFGYPQNQSSPLAFSQQAGNYQLQSWRDLKQYS